jgi:TonB family protein
MKISHRYVSSLCLVTALLLTTAGRVAAQDSLAAARDLYTAAAYEDALVVLNRLRAPSDLSDSGRAIQQYRVFCLLALGRSAEADRAIEGIIAIDPQYRPSDSDASPRIRTAFSDVRRKMLPTIIQQRYGQAKQAFDARDFAVASDGFKQVVELLNDPDARPAASQPPLSDLRTLAAGFRDLSVSAAAPPAPAPLVAAATVAATPAPPPPPPAPAPAAPLPVPVARVYSAEDGDVVPPSVLRQSLPLFPLKLVTPLSGALAIVVDEKGGVETANMLGSLSPAYDRMVLEAARSWKYKPATIDGFPVKYRRIVQINVAANR